MVEQVRLLDWEALEESWMIPPLKNVDVGELETIAGMRC